MISIPPQEKIGRGPATRICYICGRPYGVNSYDIHLKQCKDLWTAREELKEPRERKPLPDDPAIALALAKSLNGTAGSPRNGNSNGKTVKGKELEELNKIASEAFNNVALARCQLCNRTFLPEKLVIHSRSCTVDHPARRVDDSVKRGVQQSLSPTMTANLPPTEHNVPQKSSNRPSTASSTSNYRTPSRTSYDGYNTIATATVSSPADTEIEPKTTLASTMKSGPSSSISTSKGPRRKLMDEESVGTDSLATLPLVNLETADQSVILKELVQRLNMSENKISECTGIMRQAASDIAEIKIIITKLQSKI